MPTTKNGCGRWNVSVETLISCAFHRLQQGRLRLRQAAVDLVGQHQIGKDRPLLEFERAAAGGRFHHHERAQQVRRREVGRELNAAEAKLQNVGQRLDQERLAQPRHAFDEDVSTGHGGDQHLLDHVGLTHDHLGQFVSQGIEIFLKPSQVGFD